MKRGYRHIYSNPITGKKHKATYLSRREVKHVLFDFFKIEGLGCCCFYPSEVEKYFTEL